MFSLPIYGPESWNDKTEEFMRTELFRLELEHSLVSLSKWESKFEKPFLGDGEKTPEETLWYIEAMHQGEKLPADWTQHLRDEDVAKINEYIAAKMTATWFSDTGPTKNKEVITAEIVYYWMISLNVPFECRHWHLNQLLTLIRVINEKNSPPKKMSREEIIARNKRLNEERKAKYKTTG